MSEDRPVEPEYLKDILDYLSAKGVRDECPACSKNSWFIPKDIAQLWFASKKDQFSSGVLPLLVVICNNCGYVQQFSFMAFVHWMDSVGRGNKVSIEPPEVREK